MRLRLKVLIGVLISLIVLNAAQVIYDIRREIQTNKDFAQKQLNANDQIIKEAFRQLKNLKSEDKLIYYQMDKDYNDLSDNIKNTSDTLEQKLKTSEKIEQERDFNIVQQVPKQIENKFIEKKVTKEMIEKHILNGSVIVYSIRELGMGSGTVVKKTKDSMYILTCYHVIGDYYTEKNVLSVEKITVSYDYVIYPVDIIKTDENNDLALLKVYTNDSKLEEIKLAKNTPKKGDTIYTVGNPMGSERNISKGILSNYIEFISEKNNLRKFYIVDALTIFGNSGGGLYNEYGELIGVPSNVPTYGFGSAVTNMGMCIELGTIKDFIKDVI